MQSGIILGQSVCLFKTSAAYITLSPRQWKLKTLSPCHWLSMPCTSRQRYVIVFVKSHTNALFSMSRSSPCKQSLSNRYPVANCWRMCHKDASKPLCSFQLAIIILSVADCRYPSLSFKLRLRVQQKYLYKESQHHNMLHTGNPLQLVSQTGNHVGKAGLYMFQNVFLFVGCKP